MFRRASTNRPLACLLFALLMLAGAAPGHAQSSGLIVEKKVFELPTYTTVAGATIKNVRIGWEAAGTLNADRSNAILITHFFSGTSHAFGRYAPSDKTAGYWDSLIGPGKLIDTDKYYVISSDTLVNLNVKAPNVVTTGPASIDPDTGKPYGMRFPVVSIRDFVRVQKALIDSLGIKRLRAVMGASMGGLQAYEWAASYPDSVERIIPVIASTGGDGFLIGWLDAWAAPIRLDPKWIGGDYYDKEPPLDGLKLSLKLITLQAEQWEWAAKTFGTAPAEASKDPAQAFGNRFKIEAALDTMAASRAATSDANSLLYLVKANQLADTDPGKIKVPTLIIYTPTDLVFYPPSIEATARAIAGSGTQVETVQLAGPNGHLNGVLAVGQAADKIGAFLER
jgi:homoserine O-acetyltransferase